MHGIVVLVDDASSSENSGNKIEMNVNSAVAKATPTAMGNRMGAYKSIVANECLKIWKSQWIGAGPAPTKDKLWHRNLYEHIIRNENSYQNISNYIINNPKNWKDDKFF